MFSVFLSGQFIIIPSPKQIRLLQDLLLWHVSLRWWAHRGRQRGANAVKCQTCQVLLHIHSNINARCFFFHHNSSIKVFFFYRSWALYSSRSFPFFNSPAQKASTIPYMTQCRVHRSALCVVTCKVQLRVIAHSDCEAMAGGAHSLATILHYSPHY